MKQQNKIIVVGATSGLGRMLAERYIHDGHVVGIVGRRGDKLAEVAKGHPEVHFKGGCDGCRPYSHAFGRFGR